MKTKSPLKDLTLIQIILRFDTDEKARKHLESVLWKGGIVCPHCQCNDKTKIAERASCQRTTFAALSCGIWPSPQLPENDRRRAHGCWLDQSHRKAFDLSAMTPENARKLVRLAHAKAPADFSTLPCLPLATFLIEICDSLVLTKPDWKILTSHQFNQVTWCKNPNPKSRCQTGQTSRWNSHSRQMKPCAVASSIACPQAAKSQSKAASNRVNLLIRFNQSLATVSVCFVHNPRFLWTIRPRQGC